MNYAKILKCLFSHIFSKNNYVINNVQYRKYYNQNIIIHIYKPKNHKIFTIKNYKGKEGRNPGKLSKQFI